MSVEMEWVQGGADVGILGRGRAGEEAFEQTVWAVESQGHPGRGRDPSLRSSPLPPEKWLILNC